MEVQYGHGLFQPSRGLSQIPFPVLRQIPSVGTSAPSAVFPAAMDRDDALARPVASLRM
jgi:hypothetical protein